MIHTEVYDTYMIIWGDTSIAEWKYDEILELCYIGDVYLSEGKD